MIPIVGQAALVFCLAAQILGQTAAPLPGAPREKWFGGSGVDLNRPAEFRGLPLKMKARYIELLSSQRGRPSKKKGSSPDSFKFRVACAGGEMFCVMNGKAKGAGMIGNLARCTPVVLHGTIDAKRDYFVVNKIEQGWGRSQLGEEGR